MALPLLTLNGEASTPRQPLTKPPARFSKVLRMSVLLNVGTFIARLPSAREKFRGLQGRAGTGQEPNRG